MGYGARYTCCRLHLSAKEIVLSWFLFLIQNQDNPLWHDERLRFQPDIPSPVSPYLSTLRMLASHCGHVTEFGVDIGQSSFALLQGLIDHMHVTGYVEKNRATDITQEYKVTILLPLCMDLLRGINVITNIGAIKKINRRYRI